jgi:hypothetical protein
MSGGGNEMTDIAPEYVTARRVLLDALTALDPHKLLFTTPVKDT